MTGLRVAATSLWIVLVAAGAGAQGPATPAAAAPPSKIFIRPLHPGETTVSGVFEPFNAKPNGLMVRVMKGDDFLDQKPIERVDPAGAFSVTLSAPLVAGATVSVPGVTMTTATVPSVLLKPELDDDVVDGARIVHGTLRDKTGLGSVRITVFRSSLENELGGRIVQEKSIPAASVEGQAFTITLDKPLVAGQNVIAEAVTAGNEEGPRTAVSVTDPGNWGRARAYFAGGVIFSKEHGDFSKQDLALSFAIDKGWLQKPDYQMGADEARLDVVRQEASRKRNCTTNPGSVDARIHLCTSGELNDIKAAAAAYRSRGMFTFRQLNTFFDTRLTALPVVPGPSTTETTTTTKTQTSAASTTTTSTSTLNEFVESRKGAVIQVGVYAPVYGPQTSWVHEGAVNALFLAPVFRFGIQTIPGNGDGTPTVNAKGEPDDVYRFWGVGVGLGHQKLSGTTNQTPEVLSYLHIVVGKSEAFQYKKNPTDTDVVDKPRFMVEGRLKIPSTVMQVGFDANLGQGHDDIRFTFGTRFDIGELFGRLRAF